MPAINVQSSIEIAADSAKVLGIISDFNTWPTWSPWLYTEQDATVTYIGEAGTPGHGYNWEGKKVGAGSMSLGRMDKHSLSCNLQFLKPFKSQADVAFDVSTTKSDTTRVIWRMDSKLPFFMFFMRGLMVGMIRSDYRRGLLMLKDYIEKGHVPSSSTLVGVVDSESEYYVGYAGESSIEDLSIAMSERFEALSRAAESASMEITGAPMCYYNKMDVKRDSCTFTVALPTASLEEIPAPMVALSRSSGKALKLVHRGAYRHLGSAWATVIGEARAQKLKVDKRFAPFEYYISDPDTTTESDMVAELYLPLR